MPRPRALGVAASLAAVLVVSLVFAEVRRRRDALPGDAPAGAVAFARRPDQPNELAIRAAQRAVGRPLSSCSRTSLPLPDALVGQDVRVAFDPSGRVAWTEWDARSNEAAHCAATAIRDHARVPPFASTHPVVVRFTANGWW